ncbi:hypothetical protein [Pseudomonas sp. HN2-3]|uniref:hypothetical protein n=1 Tax=Pseudomonas sp. HN2-3 TaxID=2886360 RepID=UPI001D0FB6AB|nr:hypothetical protein [Pseudomonas sp. HN2-3]UDU79087.1 hypothetical protein LJX93_14890 [Pseudomonas sp. HN2-3]
MSDLKKMTVVVKNFDIQARGDLDVLFNRVRLEDEQGKTFYIKNVAMLNYLDRHGAMLKDTPRTWFYKNLSKKAVVVVAIEKPGGKIEYDLDDLRLLSYSSIIKGLLISLAMIPGGIIAATATFGLGLLLIPVGFWYGYCAIFKVPAMLRRKTLIGDLAAHGIVVR